MTLRSGEQFVSSGDARICAEAFGRPDDPAVLLIGGAATSMDFWEDEFCSRLADADRYVIRYDLRDTGRSTTYPVGEPGYTSTELIADALVVLDGFSVGAAHLVGVSMGGAIAQRLALDHPQRAVSLVLQSTTPAVAAPQNRPELPPMEPRLAAVFAVDDDGPDWSDRAAAIEAMVEGERLFTGSVPFDAERMRRIAARCYDRTTNMAAMQTNHWILDSGQPTQKQLNEITAPTLVLHGTEDPLFPYAHGEALAAEIAHARLVSLPGMGHQYPPEPLWDLTIDEVIAHTSR
ncbi:alpha/beta fold hydrolase [Nesterenkonia ebinurensis]|uniref:alpha/beta fold hydrolase n=1 Tax=Nesterenkonia ebinurensis TaxID=2608252 RepID=UPI00123D5B18|nr:alpha/beta hydrolase [Nesterenkonia ebinurensis]